MVRLNRRFVYQFNIEDFGNVTIKEYKNAKSVKFIVHPNASITITIPRFLNHNVLSNIIKNNILKLYEMRERALKRLNSNVNNSNYNIVKNPIIKLDTDIIKLEFQAIDEEKIEYKIINNHIIVYYFNKFPLASENVQKIVVTAIKSILPKLAKNYIPNRVYELANQNRITIKNVKINSARTRWGSCTSNGTINISCFVMCLPIHLIDFIILHELCHREFFNHGEQFHNKLNKLCGGKEKDLNRELKNFKFN